MTKFKLILECQYNDRVDKYIAENSNFTRSDIQKLISKHVVFVDGIMVRKSNFQVKKNSKIIITEIIEREYKVEGENILLDIIYEDNDIIVINKPSGMVVHPAPGHYKHTLVNALVYHFKNLSNINGVSRPGIVHRIDKDTSGLLVVAKTNDAHVKLANDLKEHKINRIYLAWVEGQMENDVTHINLPIGRDHKNRKKMAVTKENSKHAITHVFAKKILANRSLVECKLETGRTHQIRVHLAYIKHPIINDPLYGHAKDDFGQYLHAYKIEFNHPKTNKHLVFEAKIPKEFKALEN